MGVQRDQAGRVADVRCDSPGSTRAVSRPVPLGGRVLAGYATGGAVAGAYATVIGLMMLPYLTNTLGIGPAAAGILLLAGRVCDVLMSPVAGRLSDRTHSSIGARRPYLALGGPLLAIALAAAFASPSTGAAGYVYVLAFLVASGTAFALFQVPYAGMPAEMTDSETERTRLMTGRMAALAAASLVAGGVAPLVVDAAGGGPGGYRWMGVMVGALIAVSALVAFVGTARAPLGRAYPTEVSLRRQFAAARQSPAFRALLVCFVVQSVGIGSLLVGVRYFSDLVWDDPAATSPLFVAFIGPAIVAMPAWSRVGRRLGKLTAYRLGSLILAGACVMFVALPFMPRPLAYITVVVAGVGYAGLQVFAQALQPDCVAYDTARTGRRQAGVFTGLWTAGQSLGMGGGGLLFALLLQVSGYGPSSASGAAATPVRVAVMVGFAVIPGLLVAVALLALRGRESVNGGE